jgi:hypothetical protein
MMIKKIFIWDVSIKMKDFVLLIESYVRLLNNIWIRW